MKDVKKPLPKCVSKPCSRKGWHEFYASRFNKTGDSQSAVLAMWYYVLMLEFGEE